MMASAISSSGALNLRMFSYFLSISFNGFLQSFNYEAAEKPKECFDKAQHERKNSQ